METFGSDAVYALAALPGGACFAARESGLYRSDDNGETWHSAYESLRLNTPLSTTALAVSPAFAQDRTLFAGVSGGVLRSTDAGQSWNAIPFPEPPPLLSSLAISPAYSADDFVLATSFANGVYYTTDRGDKWYRGNYSLLDRRVLASAISPNFAEDRTVLIGTETGVFGSKNGGRSWDVIDLPYVAATSVVFAPDGVVHAGTDDDGLYTSRDKALTWARSTLDTTLSVSLILTPSAQELMVFAGVALYRSQDAGETWLTHKLHAPATAAALLNPALVVGYADGTISRVDL